MRGLGVTMVELLLQRWTIVALAIAGAVIVTGANLLLASRPQAERMAVRAGYAITFLSMVLFIVAGFMSGR